MKTIRPRVICNKGEAVCRLEGTLCHPFFALSTGLDRFVARMPGIKNDHRERNACTALQSR